MAARGAIGCIAGLRPAGREGCQEAGLKKACIQVQVADYTGPLPRCPRYPPHHLHSEAAQVERERHVL